MRRFKIIICYCLCFLLILPSVALAAATTSAPVVASKRITENAYIPEGTTIECELLTPLNSGKNSVNDPVKFKTTEAVVINGVTIISVGAVGQAVVSSVRKSGSFGKGGKISVEARSVRAINGAEVPVAFGVSKAGGTEGWVVPAFLVLSIFAGFAKGKNQDLPAGTRFNVSVSCDYDLGATPEHLGDLMIDSNKPVQKPQNAPVVPEIMTIQQAADYLQVTPEVIWQMIQEGKLKSVIVGDQYRIRKADVDNIK